MTENAISKQCGDLPWTYAKSPSINGNDDCYQIHWSGEGECVAEVVHGEKAASFIVRACNVHDELVAALELALDAEGRHLDACYRALAKSKGE